MRKRFNRLWLLAILASVASTLPVLMLVEHSSAGTTVQNASLETDANNDGVPDCWATLTSGKNRGSFTRTADAHTGSYAETITASRYSTGGRSLIIQRGSSGCGPTVTPGHGYNLTGWYKLSGSAQFTVFYKNTSGSWVQWATSPAISPASAWTQAAFTTPAVPADAAAVSFGLTLTSNGSLTVDDFALADVTPAPSPSPTPSSSPTASASPTSTSAAPLSLRIVGNHFVDGNGRTVRLIGVNRSGTQYACVEGWGIFDGPVDDTAINAMQTWHINAVRVSLNEDCWLGINGVKSAYAGVNYQSAIEAFVNRLNAHGLYVILDLHWNAPGTTQATDQEPMADRDHSPAFWQSVASTFKSNPAVLFDLYNEPYPDSNHDTTAAWTCVRDGGTCPGVSFTAAGSQEMVNAIRSTGSTNPIMVGGPEYAGDVDHWLQYEPSDPANQLAASIHIYYNTPSNPEWAPCDYQSCWENTMAPLAQSVPIVMGEFGEHDCSYGLLAGTSLSPQQPALLDWMDQHGLSYLGWDWLTANCAGEPALISNYDGTPSGYGAGVRQHYLSVNP